MSDSVEAGLGDGPGQDCGGGGAVAGLFVGGTGDVLTKQTLVNTWKSGHANGDFYCCDFWLNMLQNIAWSSTLPPGPNVVKLITSVIYEYL